MKIKELIEELKKLDQELLVVMAKDGVVNNYNDYNKLCSLFVTRYYARNPDEIELLDFEEDSMLSKTLSEEDLKQYPECLILSP